MPEIFAVRQSNEWTSNTFVLDQLNISFVVLKVRPGWKLPLFIAYIVKKRKEYSISSHLSVDHITINV